MVLTRAALLLALGACNITFDLDEPIALVPDSSWSEADVQTLQRAASCWQQQFGVPFTLDASAADQRIEVGYNELACVGGRKGGQFTPPGEIDVCPIEALQPRAFPTLVSEAARADILFIVLVHELGHAAGILGHADDLEAVMGQSGSMIFLASIEVTTFTYEEAFTAEDRAMFVDANGARTGTCDGDPIALKNVHFDGVDHVEPLECFCQVACPPDELENNDSVYRPLADKRAYDLWLCNDEPDRFQLDVAARVRIESSTCGLTMEYRDGAEYPSGSPTYGLVEVIAKPGDLITLEHPQIGVCDYRLVVE